MALPFFWQALKLKSDYDLALTNLALCCQELGLMKAAKYYIEYDSVKNSSNSWVQASYKKIHACVAEALRRAGFDPKFYQEADA